MFRVYVYLVMLVLAVGNLFGKSIPDHRQDDDAEIDEAGTKLFYELMEKDDADDDDEDDDVEDEALSDVLENRGIDGLFEGDIMLTSEEKESMSFKNADWQDSLWQNGNIPYKFVNSYPKDSKEAVIKAIVKLNKLINADGECITFRPAKEGDEDGFTIKDGKGCNSHIGDVGLKWQTVNLQPNSCEATGTVQHELIHVLGFWHEQSRSDRDEYVKIHFENIQKGREIAFDKYSNTKNQGFPYDYGSIMHYGAYYFSKNGKKTIETLHGEKIGQRSAPSSQDIAEIRRLYSCD